MRIVQASALVGMLLVSPLASSHAAAQEIDAGDDEARAWIGLDVGSFSPMTTFQDEMFGESSFESGVAVGVSAGAWMSERFGVRAKVVRSQTDGTNETSEFAPIAANDPDQWSFTAELTARQPMSFGDPYVALGAGMRHYTWAAAIHNEDKFFAITAALGAEVTPEMLGPFGIVGELRLYRSQFKQFGIHGGNWRPGTRAREGTNIGFYGGVVDKIWTNDLLVSLGLSYGF